MALVAIRQRRGGRHSHQCRGEWVGFVPDAPAVAWKQWPGMAMNPISMRRLPLSEAHGGKPLLMLCRSGVRSVASAKRATELELTAYNIPEGFEEIRRRRTSRYPRRMAPSRPAVAAELTVSAQQRQ